MSLLMDRPGDLASQARSYYHDILWSDHLASTVEGLELSRTAGKRAILRPALIPEVDVRRHGAAACAMGAAIAMAAGHLIGRPALRRQIGLPDYLNELIDLEPVHAPGSLLARLDALLSGNELRFLEYNSEPDLRQRTALTRAFERLPITAAFRTRFPCRPVVPAELLRNAIRRESLNAGGPAEPRVVVVSSSQSRSPAPSRASRTVGATPLAAHGFEVAAVDELEHRDARLRFRGRPVDMIVLQAWPDLLASRDSCAAILAAVKAGHARIAGGLSKGVLCSYKHVFELLSDPQHANLFPAQIVKALRIHVPWTRVVRDCRTTYGEKNIDLLPFLECHREHLVLKPGGARSGAGVLLGWRTDATTWSRALAAGVHRYVAQERVTCEADSYPLWSRGSAEMSQLTSDYCPYLLNGHDPQGCAVRVSDTDLHSAALGAMQTPVWILQS